MRSTYIAFCGVILLLFALPATLSFLYGPNLADLFRAILFGTGVVVATKQSRKSRIEV
jgi:hypothetical protein